MLNLLLILHAFNVYNMYENCGDIVYGKGKYKHFNR